MDLSKIYFILLYFVLINAFVVQENNENNDNYQISEEVISDDVVDSDNVESYNPANVFNGVYTECFFHLSYVCLQKKTLLYLKELNRLNEISVIGDYVKFVKLNTSENTNDGYVEDHYVPVEQNSEELAYMIDRAVDNFFDNHLIRFSALGKDVLVPNEAEEFVGRKKRKGGGGGGHGGGDDGGKKKMMMMAMMCMKMKLMMMVPAMMGMMGMMSFKGMMFSMMSFMISKMMLLMKILEKKGAGAGGGGGDGGWAAGGGGGAWMPTGQDYGGTGGGYDANGQWQSRSIIENNKEIHNEDIPIITYVRPTNRHNNAVKSMAILFNNEITKINHKNDFTKSNNEGKSKSRKKRGIIDMFQNAYLYWTNKILGIGNKKLNNYPKYRVVNGIKYVYYPIRNVKVKSPKELQPNTVKENEVQAVIVDDFNKGEIIEGPVENRMIKKKFRRVKENVNETVDMVEDNPWQ